MRYADEVGNGEAFLDEVHPGWEEGIDLDILDMSVGNSCIFGQITGIFCFPKARALLGITREQAFVMGFNIPSSKDDAEFDELTLSWHSIVSRKRSRTKVSS